MPVHFETTSAMSSSVTSSLSSDFDDCSFAISACAFVEFALEFSEQSVANFGDFA